MNTPNDHLIHLPIDTPEERDDEKESPVVPGPRSVPFLVILVIGIGG